ncbi:MAG: cell wall-binding repeat-containing protein [Parcubacteria group bacterium]
MHKAIFNLRSVTVSGLAALVVLALGGVGTFALPRSAKALSATPTKAWVADGVVSAMARSGNTVYFGGNFNEIRPHTGYGATLASSSGNLAATFSKFNGRVETSISDGSGGWYVGGDFSRVGGQTHNGLAHILSSGLVDASWTPSVAGTVVALARSGSTLYLGGSFSSVGGTARANLAAVSTANGSLTSWNPGANGAVSDLVVDGSTIYVAGSFTTIASVARNRVAALTTSAAAIGWNPNADGSLATLAVTSSAVYAGGNFSNIGSAARENIAALNKTTGAATSWNPNANGAVADILVNGSTIYVGGSFSNIAGAGRSNLAALDASGNATSWNPASNGSVKALDSDGTTLFVGGSFSTLAGGTRYNAAAVSLSGGTLTAFNPNTNGAVNTVRLVGSQVFVGGSFTGLSAPTARQRLAAYDIATGALTGWNPGANDTVKALAVSGSTIYAGGHFTNIAATGRNRIAALDTTGNALAWNPDADAFVNALAVSGSTVYAAGGFTNIGGAARDYLAALDASGSATAWNPAPNATVNALALDGTTLYLGGGFVMVDGQMRFYNAAVDTTASASPYVTAWTANTNAPVEALSLDATNVYVGGSFSNLAGTARANLGAVAKAGGLASWNPGANGTVSALANENARIYGGGSFTTLAGAGRQNIGQLSTSGAATAWDVSLDKYGQATFELSALNNALVSAGTLGSGGSQGYIALFDRPTVQFALASSNGPETTSPVTLSVVLSGPDSEAITVQYAVSGGTATNGSDYNLASGTLTIPAGSTSATISFVVTNDTSEESDETVQVTLSNPSSNAVLGSLTRHTYTIKANDLGGAGGPTPDTISRVPGSTPAEQAIEFSKRRFTTDHSVDDAIIARADIVVEALTASPLANRLDAPLLLTNPGTLDAGTLAELNRVLVNKQATIYLAGGTSALSGQVEQALRDAGYNTFERFAGANRRQTARLIGEKVAAVNGSPNDTIFVTEDRAFVDALVVGSVAGQDSDTQVEAILVNPRGEAGINSELAAYLNAHHEVTSVKLVGGTAALPSAFESALRNTGRTVTRVAGADRYATAVALIEENFNAPTRVLVARGDKGSLPGATSIGVLSNISSHLFGALLAGSYAADFNMPLLLVTSTSVPTPTLDYLTDNAASINQAYLVGDTSQIDAGVEATIAGAI